MRGDERQKNGFTFSGFKRGKDVSTGYFHEEREKGCLPVGLERSPASGKILAKSVDNLSLCQKLSLEIT